MKHSTKKKLIGVGIAAAAVIGIVALTGNKTVDFHSKYEGVDLSVDVGDTVRTGTYSKYLEAHQGATYPQRDIAINLFDYSSADDVEVYNDYEGVSKALYTGVDSKVTWKVDVPETGYYNIYVEYLAPKSRGVAVERTIKINGEVPFDDAANVVFTRIWKDAGPVRVDSRGNEFRPSQEEEFAWQASYCNDSMGFITEPYMFYLEKGMNTVSLDAVNEPLVLKGVTLKAITEMDTYEQYAAKQTAPAAVGEGRNYIQLIEGESSTYRSESSLYAKYDRSSPTTSPNSVTITVLNYVGGEAWRTSGQWIEWDFQVPEDGYYNIMIKGRQNYARGSVANRKVLIDGEVPFAEMKEVSFEYANDWECKTLGSEDGTPYRFYLKSGKHTIRLENTLGGVGDILEQLEDSTYRLNQMYRSLLVYTGSSPDKYRDYNIDQVYPEIIKAMDLESKRLYKIVDDMVAYSGQKDDKIATAQTLAQQLERFVERPDKITVEFGTFKDNITALGTATLNMSEMKLDVDYLVVSGEDATVKKDKANVFTKLWHETKSFAASFIVDYDSVGDVYEDGEEGVVKVWVMTGRDQGTILKAMVDDTFTPNTGIKVNVEIIAPEALLNAVIAGRGPNVALSVGADQPVNYALRNSAEDLRQFQGIDEVLKSFTASSYEQYGLDGALYGLPETQTFNVMFYRTDILEELGLEVPNTWQDLIEMLPTIQGNNMTVAIPTAMGSSTGAGAVAGTGDLSMYFNLLYQYGGDMYNEAGTKTRVNTEQAVRAFDDYVRYFNDYGLPVMYDFVSRFRSGEMPLGIAAYSTYNTLVVSAPEIRGLWDFTLIPGTPRVDENGNEYLDRSAFITGSATMMLKTEDEKVKQNAWEFMKWWSSADTQVRFGREIEALLGSSARYATANKDAFCQLAWTAKDIKVLNEQWEQTVGIREVPGGYYTGRHISNAIRKVINEKSDPRETIIDYSIEIEQEITKKRIEFGLPID